MDAIEPAPAASRLPEEGRGGSETVLLVEDEESVRQLAREVLETGGYQVLEAPDGGQALQLAEQHAGPIALLLTDVVMPGITGPDLARRLGARRPELKVLFDREADGRAGSAGPARLRGNGWPRIRCSR
jgi:two-component system cell cycle sensor histidine kinase/response regulator CckA